MTLAERIERIFKECEPGLWGTSGVTSWEKDRLHEWRGRGSLSPRQLGVLEAIEKKVFGAEEE